jgi:hypothetical protein
MGIEKKEQMEIVPILVAFVSFVVRSLFRWLGGLHQFTPTVSAEVCAPACQPHILVIKPFIFIDLQTKFP